MSEENKTLLRRWFAEVSTPGQEDRIPEFFSADFVCHFPDRDARGLEELRAMGEAVLAAFPDLRIAVEDQVAEGDKVVTRWTLRATHTGTYEDQAPTGRPIIMAGFTISRIADGRIVEEWEIWDEAGLMRQLGVAANDRRPGE